MMQADLIDRIMEVMECAFDARWGEAWNRRQVSDALTLPFTHALLIDAEGEEVTDRCEKAVGFTLSRHVLDEEELLLIAVAPSARGKGLGRKLLDLLAERSKGRGVSRIFLEMRSNNPAEHLYRSFGFEPIGKRPDYYLTAEGSRLDAITFGYSV
ncbi:Ribosomal-protein-S18p-alanine acetyltransferase [Altererythrobacter epoxidivorans]|uniref:Ribosomal-protein-S18p-alanine acetyltransferase n=2 Tax=Altererythrobacter epoxidivorans TaxID=361183 RepID=A0A0M4LVL8_9SPHN|nr:Ribosomal-protein-S18p-alanine acetyltransferase [Altererythrobacter epoxidivorans]